MIQLKIAIWNANGLSKHKFEVQSFLINQSIDVMLISETHFTQKNFFHINGYKVYDTKHPDGKGHGGTAILIKNGIKHYPHSRYETEHLQATCVVLEEYSGQCILSAIYCPPKYSIKQEQFTHFFKTLGDKFLVGGDYNAKHTQWGSRLTTTKGKQLFYSMQENRLNSYSTGEPTYWPTDRSKIPDLIDFCITKNIANNYISLKSCHDLSSDHSPIIALLSSEILKVQSEPRLTNKNTNWNSFRTKMNEYCPSNVRLNNAQDIDNAVEGLTQAFTKAAIESTPIIKTADNKLNIKTSIKELILKKRSIRKQFQETRSPYFKTKLNRITKKLKKVLLIDRDEGLRNYLEHLSPTEATDYSLWKATKKLNRPQVVNPPLRYANGHWARSNSEKANLFAEHLANVFKPHPGYHGDNLTVDNQSEINHPIVRFKVREVKDIIQNNINPKKSPGFDLVTAKMVMEVPENTVRLITHIANAIMRIGYFPGQWKIAQIILIPKPGKDVTHVNSYRPISLLPVLSKLFEKLLLRKLSPIISENNIIPNHQFGCRVEHSTIQQVHRVTAEIKRTFEEKKYCSAVFLDVAQAFDKVWHEGLLHKIQKGFSNQIYNVLRSYLTDRKFRVKHHEAITDFFPILSGVPQGSVLGAFLYQLFTADLPEPASRDVKMATFVDDTAILSTHVNFNTASRELQEHLNKVDQWLKKWQIKVNETKSAHVTFTLRKKTCPSVTMNGVRLPQETEVKYLGMHLDRRLTWKKHIEMKRKQLVLKTSRINWLIGHHSNLSLNCKVLLYKAIIKPVWTYGIQLWGSTSESNIELLQRFQSKTLRRLVNAPWYMSNLAIHRDLQTDLVKDVITKYSLRYQQKLQDHPNELAVGLLYQPRFQRLSRIDPLDLATRWT